MFRPVIWTCTDPSILFLVTFLVVEIHQSLQCPRSCCYLSSICFKQVNIVLLFKHSLYLWWVQTHTNIIWTIEQSRAQKATLRLEHTHTKLELSETNLPVARTSASSYFFLPPTSRYNAVSCLTLPSSQFSRHN